MVASEYVREKQELIWRGTYVMEFKVLEILLSAEWKNKYY